MTITSSPTTQSPMTQISKPRSNSMLNRERRRQRALKSKEGYAANLETILAWAKFSPTKLSVSIGFHREYFVTAVELLQKWPDSVSPLHDPSKQRGETRSDQNGFYRFPQWIEENCAWKKRYSSGDPWISSWFSFESPDHRLRWSLRERPLRLRQRFLVQDIHFSSCGNGVVDDSRVIRRRRRRALPPYYLFHLDRRRSILSTEIQSRRCVRDGHGWERSPGDDCECIRCSTNRRKTSECKREEQRTNWIEFVFVTTNDRDQSFEILRVQRVNVRHHVRDMIDDTLQTEDRFWESPEVTYAVFAVGLR